MTPDPPTDPGPIDQTPIDQTPVDRTLWRVLGAPLVEGAPDGPLAGYRVAVKDVFAVRGHAIGAGNPTWLAEAPVEDTDADAVAALLAAGADVIGIARTDELAYSLAGTNAHHGSPPNPAAPDRIPGGSSSGPAAAVAMGSVEIGLGTDTAGSVRVPASYQGLWGLRTTHGAFSRRGMVPLAPSFDTVGWLARDAATLRRVTTALTPPALTPPALTPPAPATPLVRGIVVPALLDLADAGLRASFDDAVTRLGVDRIDTVDPTGAAGLDPETLRRWTGAFRTVQGHEAWTAHGGWVRTHPNALGPDVAARFAAAATTTDEEASAAAGIVGAARDRLRALLSPGTVLLVPAASGPPPYRTARWGRIAAPGSAEIEAARSATFGLTCLAGLAGAPAVSMPLMTVGGAPVGLSGIAAPGADRALTELACSVS